MRFVFANLFLNLLGKRKLVGMVGKRPNNEPPSHINERPSNNDNKPSHNNYSTP